MTTGDDGALIAGYFQGTATIGGQTRTSAGNFDSFMLSVGTDGQAG